MCIGITQNSIDGTMVSSLQQRNFRTWCVQILRHSDLSWSVGGLELVRSAVIVHIGFCSKDCAKRKNLWTTVFTPMELVQTLVPIFFSLPRTLSRPRPHLPTRGFPRRTVTTNVCTNSIGVKTVVQRFFLLAQSLLQKPM